MKTLYLRSHRIGTHYLFGILIFLFFISAFLSPISAQITPADNPDISADCPLKIALVLDRSGSIGGAAPQVREASQAFVNSLASVNTIGESELAVIQFTSFAQMVNIPNQGSGYNAVNASYATDFATYIAGYSPGGGTSWGSAFDQVLALPTPPDLVVFFTDGFSSGSYIPKANQVKANDTHIFVVGVGSAIGSAAGEAAIQTISGPDKDFGPGTAPEIKEADYVLVSDFADLDDCFAAIPKEACNFCFISLRVEAGACTGTTFPLDVTVNYINPLSSGFTLSVNGAPPTTYSYADVPSGSTINLTGSSAGNTTMGTIVATDLLSGVGDNEECSDTDMFTAPANCCMLEVACPDVFTNLYECIADVPPPVATAGALELLGVDIGDGPCGMVTIDSDDSNNGGSGCNGDPLIITRTYTVSDQVNTTGIECVQTIRVENRPVALSSLPSDLYLECGSSKIAWDIKRWLNRIKVPDNCGGPATVTNDFNMDKLEDPCTGSNSGAFRLPVVWTIMEDCGNTYTHKADIIIEDTSSPQVSGNISDKVISCDDEIEFDTPEFDDNCDEELDITESEVEVSLDECCVYTKTWTATDNCGNSTSISQNILINDDTAPVLIPVHPLLKDIPNGGELVMECGSESTFIPTDVMATDDCKNCEADDLIVEMGDQEYFADCNENGYISKMECWWYAIDKCGNYGFYSIFIYVKDSQGPDFTKVPDDNTMECDGTPVFGTVEAEDACSEGVTITHSDSESGEACSKSYTRTWTATDACGNSTTTAQTISVIDDTAPVITSVPADVIVACTSNDQIVENGSFEDNPVDGPYGIISEDDLPGWETEASDNKIEVQRSGKVNEVVSYEGEFHAELNANNNGDLYQTLSVTPSSILQISFAHRHRPDPVNTSADIMEVFVGSDLNNLSSAMMVSSEPGDDWKVHNIYYNVPAGQTESIFLFRAVQGSPNVISIGNLIDAISVAELEGSAMIPSASDNCGHVSLSTATTGDMATDCSGGTVTRTWTATDACGNTSSAQQIITIKAKETPPSLARLAGTIETELKEMVENVRVEIPGMEGPPVMTDVEGAYSFLVASGESYIVVPEKKTNPSQGISTLDIVLITSHILGTKELTSPYQRIAADVNKSGNVTVSDLVELRQMILGDITSFSNNDAWRFVDKQYEFIDPSDPWATPFPELVSKEINEDTRADFIGIKIGDINGSAMANNLAKAKVRNTKGSLVFNIEDAQLKAREKHTISFRAEDLKQIAGYQFTLNFNADELEFANFESGALRQMTSDNIGLTQLEDGIITSSWNGDVNSLLGNDDILFSLTFNAKTSVKLSEVLSINNRSILSEAYTQDLTLLDVELTFNNLPSAHTGTITSGGKIELYQNQPNPFRGETRIGFHLPKGGKAMLNVYDVTGKLIRRVDGDYAKGYNEITVKQSDLPATGILYYQLRTADDSATRKMVLIE